MTRWKYLKGSEPMLLLGISASTMQNFSYSSPSQLSSFYLVVFRFNHRIIIWVLLIFKTSKIFYCFYYLKLFSHHTLTTRATISRKVFMFKRFIILNLLHLNIIRNLINRTYYSGIMSYLTVRLSTFITSRETNWHILPQQHLLVPNSLKSVK